MSQETPIPDKLYFKIGEVCEITGVKQHVLRYWESEFRILSPQRASSRQRLYRRADVDNVLRIKRLLKEEGFTISGAKKLLARERRQGKGAVPGPADLSRAASATAAVVEPELAASGETVAAESRARPPMVGSDQSAADPRQLPLPVAGAHARKVFGGLKQELLDLKKILER